MSNSPKLKNPKARYVRDTAIQILGSFCVAVAIKCFSAPNHIAPNGVTGIGTMLNYLFNIPIGFVNFAFNIPLLIIAYKKLGKRLVFYTLQILIFVMFLMDVVFADCFTYSGNPMLAAIFGGAINGTGIGLMFSTGATSGGADIVNKLIHKSHPYISTGQLIVAINASIIMCATLVYGELEASLYGLVMTFTSSKVVDAILYGGDVGKSCTIVTNRPDEIADAITHELKRSATMWEAKGAYKKDERWVLACVVRKQEYHLLKDLIREIDPGAFIIVSDAQQIIGKGFIPIDAEER